MNKGALALLVHGGYRKLVSGTVEAPVRRGVQGPAGSAVARCGVRSRRNPLRRGLEAGSGRTGGISQSARHFQSRRRRRCADGRHILAESAAGSRRGRRSHRSHDGICRASRADASSAGALSCAPASARSAGRRNFNGRRARFRSASWASARSERTRPRRSGRLGFRVSGWSRSAKADRRRRMLSRRGAARTVSAADRYPGLPAAADAGYAAHPESGIVRKAQPQQPAWRAGADQCRPRRAAKRSRYPACLDDGTLGAASLDVYATEPLPADSPFWTHPKSS